MLPRSDAATHVYVADSRMSFSISTFLPIGMLSSGVSSNAPSRHLTNGIGDPTATHVRLTDPPGMTSTFSGGIEKCGGTRRTVHTKCTKQWRRRNRGFRRLNGPGPASSWGPPIAGWHNSFSQNHVWHHLQLQLQITIMFTSIKTLGGWGWWLMTWLMTTNITQRICPMDGGTLKLASDIEVGSVRVRHTDSVLRYTLVFAFVWLQTLLDL